jgi:hypothetical protein
MKYRNPKYTVDGRIDCEIEHPDYGWIPFTADPNDPEEYGRNLFEQIKSVGNITAYAAPPGPSEEDLAINVRDQRNRLLAGSDWTQVADAPVDKAAWVIYRQALRDMPQQSGFPSDVIWPTAPLA